MIYRSSLRGDCHRKTLNIPESQQYGEYSVILVIRVLYFADVSEVYAVSGLLSNPDSYQWSIMHNLPYYSL